MNSVYMTKWDQRFIYLSLGLGCANLFNVIRLLYMVRNIQECLGE